MQLGVNYRKWICDGCECEFSSEGKGEDDVLVWRCEQDRRYEGGEQIRPGGAQTVENSGVGAQYEEDLQLALALSLSLQTDNDQALAQDEKNLDGAEIKGAAASTEEDQQVIILLYQFSVTTLY